MKPRKRSGRLLLSGYRGDLNAGAGEQADRDTGEFEDGNKENRYSWYRSLDYSAIK